MSARRDGQKTELTDCELAFRKSNEAGEHAAHGDAFRAFRAGWYARADADAPADKPSERAPTLDFDAIRDAIVTRMGGHTISSRDGPVWDNFMGLLRQVKASECGVARSASAPALSIAAREEIGFLASFLIGYAGRGGRDLPVVVEKAERIRALIVDHTQI